MEQLVETPLMTMMAQMDFASCEQLVTPPALVIEQTILDYHLF